MADQKYELLPTNNPPRKRSWRLVAASCGLLIVSAFFIYRTSYKPPFISESSPHDFSTTGGTLKQCNSVAPTAAKAPAPKNIWAPLTVAETAHIYTWLEHPARHLNLTSYHSSVALSDNVIFLIEAYTPPKAAALAYLESPYTVSPPDQYAKVTIHHGGENTPYIQNYLVGPLPIGPATTIKTLTDIYHRDIPFNSRHIVAPDELSELLQRLATPILPAMTELFGHGELMASGAGPFGFDGSFRRMWLNWKRSVTGPWLHPVNFFQYVDLSGTDPSLWKVLKIVYNHQIFSSAEEFMEAFYNGTLVRIPSNEDEDVSWTTRKRTGPPRDLEHLPGPRSVSFAGKRFRVDRELQYVTWMGWGMYLGFNRDMGLNMWDMRFKGERIIYELTPQEAIAQYSGNDPYQSSTAWLDGHFGMGTSVRDMLPGYDCPQESVYLPARSHTAAGTIIRERGICIFEQDSGRPITRHTGYKNSEFGAVKGYILTIRSISTVGNYDYCKSSISFDYMFHLDGTMEVRISASGFLQGAYWEPTQDSYGGRIHDTSMGSLHHHIINYKVDFDIAGTSNSLQRTSVIEEEVVQEWLDEDWGKDVLQNRIVKEVISNENEALLKYPTDALGGFAIINQEKKNAWGYPRGYAIHPGYSAIYHALVGSKRLLNNANWARYNLAVSKRKETEPASSSVWNMNLAGKPVVDFHNFFDGENITQEDVVAWINVGMHHFPQAEDAPNTKTNVAMSSFILTPLNYFDTDAAMDMTNAIVLNVPENEGDAFTFDDYGVKQEYTCVPETPEAFNYKPIKVYDAHGSIVPPSSMEENRKNSEMFHRIELEL